MAETAKIPGSNLSTWLVRGGLAALLIAVVVGGRVVMAKLEGYVLARPEYQSAPDRLRINQPDFMPDDLFRRVIREQHNLPARFSAADPAILRSVFESYRTNPWVQVTEIRRGDQTFVRSEVQVRHKHPNEVEVTLLYRRPAAVVRQGDRYYWIDSAGVVLADGWEDGSFEPEQGAVAKGPRGKPGRWLPLTSDAAGIKTCTLQRSGQDNWQSVAPIIEGVTLPPPAPGKKWADPGLDAARELIAWLNTKDTQAEAKSLLRREIKTVTVVREELASFVRHSVRLVTPGGTVIEWGRPPDTNMEGHIDPPAEKKLERLRQVQAELKGLDGKFKFVSLRAGKKEDGVRGVRWVFAAPEKFPAPVDETAALTNARPPPRNTPNRPRATPPGSQRPAR